MKITREVLILREMISLLEALKPAQRDRCMAELAQRFYPALWPTSPPPSRPEPRMEDTHGA